MCFTLNQHCECPIQECKLVLQSLHFSYSFRKKLLVLKKNSSHSNKIFTIYFIYKIQFHDHFLTGLEMKPNKIAAVAFPFCCFKFLKWQFVL